MNRNEILNQIKTQNTFSRKDLRNIIKEVDPTYNFNNLSSLLNGYLQKKLIKKISHDTYTVTTTKSTYAFKLDENLQVIKNDLEKQFPTIQFQVWSFSQLNEFLNHLLANKTYVIEVEAKFMQSFFEILKEKYDNVLLNPNSEQFFYYAKWGSIIVKKLISESPTDLDSPHQIRLEKLLVDVLVDKFVANLINSSELQNIYEYCFHHYEIDQRKLLRYARRRNAEAKIKLLLNQTKG